MSLRLHTRARSANTTPSSPRHSGRSPGYRIHSPQRTCSRRSPTIKSSSNPTVYQSNHTPKPTLKHTENHMTVATHAKPKAEAKPAAAPKAAKKTGRVKFTPARFDRINAHLITSDN